jgi:hypothetical protein
VERAVEIVKYFETSASLTAHAGISFFEKGSLPGGPASIDPPLLNPWGKHKDCQPSDVGIGH